MVRIIEISGYHRLDNAALQALKKSSFISKFEKILDLLRKYPEDLQFPNEIRKPNPKKRQGIQTAHRCNARPFS